MTNTESYVLKGGKFGSIWVALDSKLALTAAETAKQSKPIRAGDAKVVASRTSIKFLAANSTGHILVITPKTDHQDLTIKPFILDGPIEDASDRNATLLIAISDCRLQDTWNRGDESQWIPSKPEVISLKAGEMKWIRPGIHHFKNLDSNKPRLVTIEW